MSLLQVVLITYFTAVSCYNEHTTNNFDKHFLFFDLFHSCTIFFSRKPNEWPNLHLSLLNFCTKNPNRNCIQLHSTAAKSSQKLLAAKSVPQKFKTNCFVHLPTIEIGKELRFEHKSYVYHTPIYGKRDYQPDFTLLPIFTKFRENFPLVRNSPYILSKIFILSNVTSDILTVCLQCLRHVSLGFPELPVVKLLQNEFTSRENLENIWDRVNFPNVQIAQESKNQNCPYHRGTSRFLGYVYTGVEVLKPLSSCILAIVLEKLNGSIVSESLKRHYIKKPMASLGKYPKIVSYDVQSFALNFGFFIEKPKSKMENVSSVGMLSPFSLLDWLIIFIFLVGIATVLNLFKINGNSYFWIFATLLEQGDVDHSSRKPGNVLLLMLWLVGLALHLRNLYTCSLYTYMTKDPGPANIPEDLESLLNIKNVRILSNIEHITYIEQLYIKWITENAIQIESSDPTLRNIVFRQCF